MSEFKLTRRTPDEQLAYWMEKFYALRDERDAAYAVLEKLIRPYYVERPFIPYELFQEMSELLAKGRK